MEGAGSPFPLPAALSAASVGNAVFGAQLARRTDLRNWFRPRTPLDLACFRVSEFPRRDRHALEQYATGQLIRPRAKYVGGAHHEAGKMKRPAARSFF